MIDLKTHNRLNGSRFVGAEFGLIVALVATFGIYFGIRGRWLLALIAFGIVSNCVVVLVYAVLSLTGGEPDLGIRALYTDAAARRKVAREHPNLSGETLLLTAAASLPLALTAWTGWELAQRRR
ncbi:MAG: hypothetical protein JF888_02145 [Candidatus Dormibacteraeota bacterium]|uniref:Uncharacterized protein n=1 Tax=Candidatus Dormiibacter inghamiae TaxID=3127013 RepID=A0A934K7R3_9BACT|nr:hypothetical protein [Candidatus Dormibacteraeota bacterium]MBJ7605385.1 hypothetical protein [Candidatus Dormibacteraeota bacterium]